MKTAEMDPVETRRFRRGERTSEPVSSGLFGSLRHLFGTALAMFQSRIELIAVELREEKKRALVVLGWVAVLVFLSFMTVLAIVGVVVFLFWEQALVVLIGFSIFFLAVAVGSFFVARSKLKKIPFGETIAQLKKDGELIAEKLS